MDNFLANNQIFILNFFQMVVNLLHNMDTKTSSQLLDEISVITRKNLALIEENFNSLTDTQLSWRKDKNSWNINEIFAHLNEYAR